MAVAAEVDHDAEGPAADSVDCSAIGVEDRDSHSEGLDGLGDPEELVGLYTSVEIADYWALGSHLEGLVGVEEGLEGDLEEGHYRDQVDSDCKGRIDDYHGREARPQRAGAVDTEVAVVGMRIEDDSKEEGREAAEEEENCTAEQPSGSIEFAAGFVRVATQCEAPVEAEELAELEYMMILN